MRTPIVVSLVAVILLPAILHAGNLPIVPTTTLKAETSNNTSTADTFAAQTNGNLGAGNVSKVDIHSLLYPGANTKVIAHFMPWWGDKRHINVGYSSHDPAQIHRQITDMISRGIDGVIIDWYGSADYTDLTAKLVMAEAEQHPGFTFAIMVDKGALQLSACQGCTPQQTLIQQVQYVEQTYIPSSAYMRISGRPMITNFDIDLHYTIDWNAVQAATSTNPDLVFQHASGFTHAVSEGSYAWVIVNVSDFGMSYLSKFYKAGLAVPQEEAFGGVYKGFNDTLASWGENRIMSQQCGQTWLQTFSQINSFYNSGKPLANVQLVTWNDYEEGTEIESGIDNCVTASASLAGTALQWKITGNESTVDHYVVYISTDGKNLMPLNTMAAGSRSLDLGTYSLAAGSYTAFVQAVGKPTMKNQMSGAVKYTVQPTGGTTITLGASPTAVTVAANQSANSTVTVNPVSGSFPSAVTLSCSDLPVNVSCVFSPSSLTPGSHSANSALTVSVSPVSNALNRGGLGMTLGSFGIMGVAVMGSFFTRKRLRQSVLLGATVVMMGLLSSCGMNATSHVVEAGTPVGVYAVTLHADSGSQHVTLPVTLTVK